MQAGAERGIRPDDAGQLDVGCAYARSRQSQATRNAEARVGMASCPKCATMNFEGATRCRACNAVIPIKLGSASEHQYERAGLQPTHTGLKCPHCGATNPYTRFKCRQCGVSLTQHKRPGLFDQAWTYLALGAVLLIVMFVALRGG